MTARTQGLVAVLLGAVLLRIALTGEYLRFVLPWMRWPLVATGVVLLVMGARPALGNGGTDAPVPRTTWLLLVPPLVVFALAPQPLGAYLAERRPSQPPREPAQVRHLDQGASAGADQSAPIPVGVDEFVWGAAQTDDVMGLSGTSVELEGFVSTDADGRWYVSRMVIFCCAADALVQRVEVLGAPAPARDQWVRVIGVWVDGSGRGFDGSTQISAHRVVRIPEPEEPYA